MRNMFFLIGGISKKEDFFSAKGAMSPGSATRSTVADYGGK